MLVLMWPGLFSDFTRLAALWISPFNHSNRLFCNSIIWGLFFVCSSYLLNMISMVLKKSGSRPLVVLEPSSLVLNSAVIISIWAKSYFLDILIQRSQSSWVVRVSSNRPTSFKQDFSCIKQRMGAMFCTSNNSFEKSIL